MSVSEAVRDFVDDTVESTELATRNGFHLEPRCRVCRNDGMRKKVNDLLATGASYAMVLRALGEDNTKLDKCDRVTIDSVRNHCGRHFPVQQTTHATYREILERRARENQVDFVEGVAMALTPMAFYEVVMAKAFAPWWTTAPRSVWRPVCEPPRSSSASSTGVSGAPTSSS